MTCEQCTFWESVVDFSQTLILGHTPVVAVEWEPYACRVLRERAIEGWFPELDVWEGDVRDFDPSEYAGRVDCIHAGFPCQDISTAGKQAGVVEGTRSGLYREVLRIAGAIRPDELYLENVAAIKSNGLETVLKDLAVLGMTVGGCAYEHPMSGRTITATDGFAFVATPTTKANQLMPSMMKHRLRESRQIDVADSTTAHNAKEGGYPAEGTRNTPSLAWVIGGK